MAPTDIRVDLYRGLGELPPFNPDIEADGAPQVVRELRSRIISSHALLIASPEYAHGVSGVMKNALDWMVGKACATVGILGSGLNEDGILRDVEIITAIRGVLRALQRVSVTVLRWSSEEGK